MIMKYIYRIYQILVALPVIIVLTALTALVTIIGCTLGDGHFWGYYPPVIWSKLVLKVLFIPVRVVGRENLEHGRSYVFIANHQGAFDIFLVFGHLGRNFKWMMKRQLRAIPLVGYACEKSHQIFVDKRGPSHVKDSYDRARRTLRGGMSVVVFPEGTRTYDGTVGSFKRGAFMLADELRLPVVPMTIIGSFELMPRTDKYYRVCRRPLTLVIHKPVEPLSQGPGNVARLMEESRKAVLGSLHG